MGIFDFIKKKTVDAVNPSSAIREVTKSSINKSMNDRNASSDSSRMLQDNIRNSIVGKSGLYPHEVLMLNYAHMYTENQSEFQGFWSYKYGVNEPNKILGSLAERGYLQSGGIKLSLEKESVSSLKTILRSHNVADKGKKEELILRILSEVPESELKSQFPKRYYELTDKGKKAIADEEYVIYIHRHPNIEDLDVWKLNSLVYNPPYHPFRDKIWGYLNQKSLEHIQNRDFGLYRSTRYNMHCFLLEESKTNDALRLLTEVIYYDLSGMDNNFNMEFLNIKFANYFPYSESTVTLAPGIIGSLRDILSNLQMNDDDLKKYLKMEFDKLGVLFHIFTKDECVDIVLAELHSDHELLARIYETAKIRLVKKYPELKKNH